MKIFLVKDSKGVQEKDTVWLVYAKDDVKIEDLVVDNEYMSLDSESTKFHNVSVYTGESFDCGESSATDISVRDSRLIEDFVEKYPNGLATELFPGPINSIIEFCDFQCIQKCPENCSECVLKKFTKKFVLPGKRE